VRVLGFFSNLFKKKETEDRIYNLFSPLQRALKKYERDSLDQDLIQIYLDSSIKGLKEDPKLKILNVLQKMKAAIENDSLGFKDKEKEKILERIPLIKKEDLEKAGKDHERLANELKAAENMIKLNSVMHDLKDIDYKIEHTKNEILRIDENIDKLKNMKDKTDPETMQKELEEKLKNLTMIEVKII